MVVFGGGATLEVEAGMEEDLDGDVEYLDKAEKQDKCPVSLDNNS